MKSTFKETSSLYSNFRSEQQETVYLGRLVVSSKTLCLQFCIVKIIKSHNNLHNGGMAFRSEFFFPLKQQIPLGDIERSKRHLFFKDNPSNIL